MKNIFLISILLITSCESSNESPWLFVTKYFTSCEIPVPPGDVQRHHNQLIQLAQEHQGEEIILMNINPKADYIYFERFYFGAPLVGGKATFALITKESYLSTKDSTKREYQIVNNLDSTHYYFTSSCFDEILSQHPDFKTDLIEKPGGRPTDMFPY